MRLQDYDTETRYQASLLESHRITAVQSPDDVRELTLEISQRDFHFAIGQNVGVLVPGPHAFGHEAHFRLYTIADIPAASATGHYLRPCCH